MPIKLSIIVPTYNEQAVIKACLESLFKQDYSSYEVIVVDDGSTDKTLSVLEEFTLSHKDLIIMKQQHKGAGAARNFGATKAKGEILIFVDADMTFDASFLSNLVKPMLTGKIIGTFSKNEFVSNWDNIWSKCWNWNLDLPDKKRLPDNYPDTQKVFRAIKKTDFLRVGGFSRGGYTDDWTLSEKLGEFAHNSANAVFYHSNPSSLSEVFTQAQWSAKRQYKLQLLGSVIALIRVNICFSLIVGILKSIKHHDIRFLVFKLVYDLGIAVGIVSYTLFKNGAK